MPKKTDIEKSRSEYLKVCRGLLLEVLSRQDMYMCPGIEGDDKEKLETAKMIAACSERISSLCREMSEIEKTAGIGVSALLGHGKVSDTMRITVVALVCERLTGQLRIRRTRDLCDLHCRDTDAMLQCRQAFGDTGILSGHCHRELAETVDRHAPSLTEAAFRTLLGLQGEDGEIAVVLGAGAGGRLRGRY